MNGSEDEGQRRVNVCSAHFATWYRSQKCVLCVSSHSLLVNQDGAAFILVLRYTVQRQFRFICWLFEDESRLNQITSVLKRNDSLAEEN